MRIRPTIEADLPAIGAVAEQTGLFPSSMLPDMVAEFLAASGPGSGPLSGPEPDDLWLTAELDGQVAGFCYAAPETLTNGTWNMLAIGVDPARQGMGIGSAIVAELETRLRAQGQRLLIADTSGTPAFERTRHFYLKAGYAQEAVIRDFWDADDDKVTFAKPLTR